MESIVSPTSKERIFRTSAILIGAAVFGAWFLHDGYRGYPEKNLSKAIESLDPAPSVRPLPDVSITHGAADTLIRELKDTRLTRSDAVSRFGEPAWQSADGNELRYFGPGGVLRLSMLGESVREAMYLPGDKDDGELLWQKILGFGLLPIAVLMFGQLLRVLSARFELSADGLKLPGRRMIPLDDITKLDISLFEKKGIAELRYSAGGKTKRVRLDEYLVRDLDAIVRGICERRGFRQPSTPASPSA